MKFVLQTIDDYALFTCEGEQNTRYPIAVLTSNNYWPPQIRAVEATLSGALRREQVSQVAARRYADEIEQLQSLVQILFGPNFSSDFFFSYILFCLPLWMLTFANSGSTLPPTLVLSQKSARLPLTLTIPTQVRQRDQNAQSGKMILRFRDERIHRLEACLAGRMPMDHYLMDENKRLVEEIELVRRQNDHNPELTRFAMDNIRLMEQVRGYVVSNL